MNILFWIIIFVVSCLLIGVLCAIDDHFRKKHDDKYRYPKFNMLREIDENPQ